MQNNPVHGSLNLWFRIRENVVEEIYPYDRAVDVLPNSEKGV